MIPNPHIPAFIRQGPVEWVGTGEFKDAMPVDGSARRKTAPIGTGFFDYFPDAIWAVAELAYWGNEKHNPGEVLHDNRSTSNDDVDCLLRHLKDRGTWDTIPLPNGKSARVRHSAAVAWRALRILQKECEADGAPLARGAILTKETVTHGD